MYIKLPGIKYAVTLFFFLCHSFPLSPAFLCLFPSLIFLFSPLSLHLWCKGGSALSLSSLLSTIKTIPMEKLRMSYSLEGLTPNGSQLQRAFFILCLHSSHFVHLYKITFFLHTRRLPLVLLRLGPPALAPSLSQQ